MKYRTRAEVDLNAFLWFFHTLRKVVDFIPDVILTGYEVYAWERKF